ncbi:1766f491-9375-44ff-8f3f-27895c6e911a [Thermothielavioides terrestris]|uniref:1766f491-9375-44ff-8f3f-27895c6e911a n=1 Tax=Thermothielavioides terrestris TaxID=2587410 RepID=A0A446B927_9PEZI|nr:1766f491-9375-44ff-8f3f-27895c6e911a [Thermothielavioides terrestris]
MVTASPVIARPLGPCEIYSSSRHALGFYKCVANTCRYSVPLAQLGGQQAIRAVLQAAVARVVLAVPSLSVGIAGQDTSKPHFVQLPSIDLDNHIEWLARPSAEPEVQDASLLNILEDRHDRLWPDIERQPPWKLTVVVWDDVPQPGSLEVDIVFAVHHAIADGRSTGAFHTRLLNELNHPSGPPAQLSGPILGTTEVCGLAPPQEELVRFSLSWSFVLRTLWGALGPAWLQGRRPPAPWTGKVVTREPCRTKLRLVTIPAVAVPRILAACRAHQTTLTPLLHALVLVSLARHVPREQAQAFCSSTPIDLRPFVETASQAGRPIWGVLVTTRSDTFDASTIATMRDGTSEDEIWKIAADLRRSMKRHLDNVPNDDIMGMLSWVGNWRQYWLAKVGKPREATWEVSNIGVIDGGPAQRQEATEGWKIQRSIMSQGATVAGAAVSINAAGVAGGEIGIALGWQDGIVETEIVHGLAADLQRWLDRLGRGQNLVEQ